MTSSRDRDRLFYEDALNAIEELEEEVKSKRTKLHRPALILIGAIAVLILVSSLIPFYSLRVNPPPSTIQINYFELSENEILEMESLSTEHFSSIPEAIAKTNPEDYKQVSSRLATSSCRTSSDVCYAKALYLYIQKKVTYISDPSSREYVQLPQQTLLQKSGDCEDKSLLLAAMLESIGIDADVGVTSNHAFVRAKLPDAAFWIKRNSDYVFLDPSSDKDFGEVSLTEEEVVKFYEIY